MARDSFLKKILDQDEKALKKAMEIAIREAKITLSLFPQASILKEPQDFATEAVILLFNRISTKQDIDNVEAYLKQIVRNSVRKFLTKEGKLQTEPIENQSYIPEDSPIESIETQFDQLQRGFQILIQQGKSTCAEILQSFYLKELSGPELAIAFGMTKRSIRVKLHRCREALRRAIGVK